MRSIIRVSACTFWIAILIGNLAALSFAQNYDIGVYYFPGWKSDSNYWNDLKGLPGSKSPSVSWPDREPLLGFNYPEEEVWVAEQQIEWASQYGINFFAYDWYWNGTQSYLEHAIKAYLKSTNKDKLKFCLMWDNNSVVPRNLKEFDDMIAYWIQNYFNQPTYYRIQDEPVIFIYVRNVLEDNARKFGESTKTLFNRARAKAKEAGLKGIYFIAETWVRPENSLEDNIASQGYDAYTGWNYVASKDKSRVADYNSTVDSYLDYYNAAFDTSHKLPYIVSVSPGYDNRPWLGTSAFVRKDPTPEKFKRMLCGAKRIIKNPAIPKIIMIEAWNEYAEGSYIAPMKKSGFQYLETISSVCGNQ